jgi:hypothetical protein
MSRKQETILQHLENLTPQEAHFLVVALEKNAQTIYWKHDDNEVRSLKAKGLLESVPDDSPLLYKPFSIPRFVWEHIKTPEVMPALKAKAVANKST